MRIRPILAMQLAIALSLGHSAIAGPPGPNPDGPGSDGKPNILGATADSTSGMLFLHGDKLGSKAPRVQLEDRLLAVDSFSPTDIVATLPANQPAGSYLVLSR